MMLLAAAATIAIVMQDQAALRMAPHHSAQQQTVLWQGDVLEIRGSRADYLQVYDHRRERGGYIRASQVRAVGVEPADAKDLLAIVRFLRDMPGSEALGIAYAAAFLKAAAPEAIDAEVFDALGTMADRLASRPKVAAHLEVAASYGVVLKSLERNGRVQLCYDGEAFRRVLALPASADQRARAALALTRPECVDPDLPPLERQSTDRWRAEILDKVDVAQLPEPMKNRIRMRRAGVWAAVAFAHSRSGEPTEDAANRALQELAAINKIELADEDQGTYTEAAVRVGASRWAAASAPELKPGYTLVTLPAGHAGETCLGVTYFREKPNGPGRPAKGQRFERCTYGTVWMSSVRTNATGNAIVVAVQPLDTWCELWVIRRNAEGNWALDVLPPANTDPDVGYAEFAGWVPDGKRILVARESRSEGRWQRTFEVVHLGSLVTQKHADTPASLSTFYKWQSPDWKSQTVSLR
jgi:hypothetical protein